MSVFSITKNNFKEEVMKSEKPVLIDLWATWCGPCKMMSPIVDEISESHPEIKVCKINVDDEPELAQVFEVSAIPMIVMMEEGKVNKAFVGYKPKAELEEMLQ